MLLIKRLFYFSKPRFLELDYIDIVLEDKILFLVVWKSKRHQRIKIPLLNKKYRGHETAVILKLPANTMELSIILFSLWRKRRYQISLKKLKLDEETTQHLITKFKPIKMLSLKTPAINLVPTFHDTNLPIIILKRHDLSINTPLISSNTDKLTYITKTTIL